MGLPCYDADMRIVILTLDIEGRNGWSRYAVDLGKALHAQGHELHCIVATKQSAAWCTRYRLLRQPTSYMNHAWLRTIDAWRLHRLLKKIQPDIVHFMAEPYALLLPMLGTNPWRTCMTIHGTYSVLPFSYGNTTSTLFEEAYCRCDAIISVSHFTKNYVKERAPELFQKAGLEKKITVLHNAVDLARFPLTEKKPKTNERTIISVSAVKPKKGYMTAVDAVARFLREHNIPLHYDIYGSTTMSPHFIAELRTRIKTLRLDNVVTLHGSVDDATIEKAYADADVFLLPSLHDGDHFEGFGLVFLEANARGTPVIGTRTGGIPEAISDGISGYICPPEDPESIAKRLADILIHHKIDHEACKEWAQKHDVIHAVRELEKIYTAL